MEYSAIVAGTGFEGRAGRIRLAAKPGMSVKLVREPDNPHDPNAIAVYLTVRAWYTLFLRTDVHIGYIKRDRAKTFAARLADGGNILSATVKSMHLEQNHPRVSLTILTDW